MTLADLDPATLALPRSRRTALTTLATALASNEIDLSPAAPWSDARRLLAALPGVGPWSIETIAMRGLGDPDAFLAGDLGVIGAARRLGLPSTPAALAAVRRHGARGGPTPSSIYGQPAITPSTDSLHAATHPWAGL